MLDRSDRWQKRVERGMRRQRQKRTFTCTICGQDVPFAWTCPCGFMICADCFAENAWGLTCNNVTWECPDCGASARSEVAMDEKDKVRAFFTKRAAAYTENDSQRGGPDLLRLIERLPLSDEDVALDVATGVGHTAIALAPHVKSVIGLDLTPRMQEEFERNAAQAGVTNATFVLGDAESLEAADEAFDLVTCRRAIHHFPDPAAALTGIARVLRPGGLAGFVDMAAPEDTAGATLMNAIECARDDSHVLALSPTVWRSLLELTGFTIESEDILPDRIPWNDWLSPLPAGGPEDDTARSLLDTIPEGRASVVEESEEGLFFLKRRIVIVAKRRGE